MLDKNPLEALEAQRRVEPAENRLAQEERDKREAKEREAKEAWWRSHVPRHGSLSLKVVEAHNVGPIGVVDPLTKCVIKCSQTKQEFARFGEVARPYVQS